MASPTEDIQADLTVELAGVRLSNPLMTASGTCGYASEYADFVDLRGLGAFVTKSITAESRLGNEYPRVVETRAGMLNSIGLANVGLDAFLDQKVPQLQAMGLPTFVNVAGSRVEDYVKVAGALDGVEPIRGVELNISCPNVKEGGMQFGVDPRQVREVTAALRRACRTNILVVKLSPNVSDVAETAAAAVEGGADALSLINTLTGLAIDPERRRPVLGGGTGGLSGPAIRPVAVAMVHRVYTQVARQAGVPLIGIGGIQYPRDALEFLLAGATALEIGTALFVDPGCLINIRRGVSDYLMRHGYKSIRDIVGALEAGPG